MTRPSRGVAFQAGLLVGVLASARVDAERRPMTVEDIVRLREIPEVRISRDGKWVAYVVKQANLESNDYRLGLEVVSATPTTEEGRTRRAPLAEGKSISNVRWSPTSEVLYYLGGPTGVMRVRRGGTPEVALERPAISQFEISPDGRRIALVTRAEAGVASEARGSGVVYDDRVHNVLSLISSSWVHAEVPSSLWIQDLGGKTGQPVWTHRRTIYEIAWAPHGGAIAVTYAVVSRPEEGGVAFDTDVGILSLIDGKFTPVATTARAERRPTWSPDGSSLAFVVSGGQVSRIRIASLTGKDSVDLAEAFPIGSQASLEWDHRHERMLIAKTDRDASTLFAVAIGGGAVARVLSSPDHLSSFSFGAEGRLAACIRQNPTIPPDVALVDLSTGAVNTLTRVNPEVETMELAQVEKRQWRNKHGDETNGWLVKPLGFREGRTYPLLVMMYGYTGRFVSQAEWETSFPTQAFAANGFLVLMMNEPRGAGGIAVSGQNIVGDHRAAQLREAYSPLASVEAAVAMLTREGLADGNRKGMLGWSHGGFQVQFAITHADLFQAVSAGECGQWNPGDYWAVGSATYRKVAENILGGPPYGETFKNYQEFSPALNAHRVAAPVLAEFADRHISALEFYTALRRHQKPVELVFYPGEGHIFSQPKHRLASMTRNLDWFKFWLQGKEDPDLQKRDQYARWHTMRHDLGRGEEDRHPAPPKP